MDKSMLGDLDSLPVADKIRMSSMIDQLQIRDRIQPITMRSKNSGKKAAEHSTQPQFISEAAQLRHEQGMQNKSFAAEKGFIAMEGVFVKYPTYVTSIIQESNWARFCSRPKAVIMNLVREFHANFEGELPSQVRVRNHKVQISPTVINSFYNLEDVDDEFYAHADNLSPPFLRAVLKEIAEPQSEWVVSKTGSFSLPRITLLPAAKVWYHFLKSRLFPSSHGQHVTRERAILLYCILTGQRINIGTIIYRNICANALKPRGQFLFPSLISGLCELAGVIYDEQEEKLALAPSITPLAVKRIALNKPEGEGTDEEEERRHHPHAASTEATSSNNNNLQQKIFDSLEFLHTKFEWHKHDVETVKQQLHTQEMLQYQMSESLKSLKRKSRTFWCYSHLRDKALIASLNKKAKDPSPIFPRFPTALLHNSDSESEKEE